MNELNLNGLVLSGGQSTRMGSDKGELQYHKKTQRQYLFELLSHFCDAVFISCNKQQSTYINNLPIIIDEHANIGPLNGVLSAFQSNPNTAWLVVACDFPFINDETIQFLIHHRNTTKMATAFLDEATNLPEPLLTIWEPKAYQILLQSIQQKNYSPRKALMNEDVELLQTPDSSVLRNINTIDEHQQVLYALQHTNASHS